MTTTTQPRDSIVRVDNARVSFGANDAVHNVSFGLTGGNLLGLIGPNGAGKTTLLRAIAGMQPLSGGSVRILGEDLDQKDGEARRHLGFTPDTPTFYERLTVRQFLQFIAIGYGIDSADARERIDFWLEKVWLSEKANQRIKSLSRGMRQRVGLARTLLPNPAIILLDEPAAGLDPAGRVQFRQLLCDLREQGKALIISSHILADMEEYCTHIGIMAHGVMLRFGSVADVSAHAQSAGRCRYTLIVAQPTAHLESALANVQGLTQLQLDRDRASFEFSSSRPDAADLLARLVSERIPVASFVPQPLGLEEAYLRIGIQQVD